MDCHPPNSSGTGNATVSYSVQANSGSSARTGTLTIAGLTFTVQEGAQFLDVSPNHPFAAEISKLSALGVTVGCGGGNFCPDATLTREQMAILIRGRWAPSIRQHRLSSASRMCRRRG